MKNQLYILPFLVLMSFSTNVNAQDEEKPVVEVTSVDNLGNVDDAFQENFFEALKQKAIENYQKAIVALEKCRSISPDELIVYLELGKNYNKLQDFPQAEAVLQKGLELAPKNEELLQELYNTYFLNRDFENALPVVQDLVQADPSFSEDLVNLYILNEKFDEALELLDSLDEKKGSSTYRDGLRRQVYARTKNVQAQIEGLEESIEENPQDEQDYLNLIFVYSENGEVEKAFETAQKLLEVNPASELVHLALYKFYITQKDSEKAVESMQILLGSNQIDEVTKYQALNDFLIYVTEDASLEEDLIDLVGVFSENENNSKVYKQLGKFFLEKGNKGLALDYLKMALESEAGDFGLYREVLELQLGMGDFENLATLSTQALEVFPAQPYLYLMKGKALHKLSKFKEAETSLLEGLDYLIDDTTLEVKFYNELVKVYTGLNLPAKASEYEMKAKNLKTKI